MTVSFIANAWGDVGRALFDVPDTELEGLAGDLRGLATARPGRAADVLHALAAMVETEQRWRRDERQAHRVAQDGPA
jgi:hypothetical protein